jgi:hypothetical protein
MEYQNQQPQDLFPRNQQPLPNATTVLVLGILSIVVCFICGIVALAISSNDLQRYKAAPEFYTSSSYELLKAGRICGIIGICISGIAILIYICVIVFALSIGTFGSFNH